jgi:hypothetical protein
VTFQNTLKVVVTILSGRIGREGDNMVVASEDGIEDNMDVSPSTSSNSHLNSDIDQNPHLQPDISIKFTLENFIIRILSNCLSKINTNCLCLSTTLPQHRLQVTQSYPQVLSFLLISIFLLLCAKGFDQMCWNKRKVPQHLTLSLTISHLKHYHMRTKHL